MYIVEDYENYDEIIFWNPTMVQPGRHCGVEKYKEDLFVGVMTIKDFGTLWHIENRV